MHFTKDVPCMRFMAQSPGFGGQKNLHETLKGKMLARRGFALSAIAISAVTVPASCFINHYPTLCARRIHPASSSSPTFSYKPESYVKQSIRIGKHESRISSLHMNARSTGIAIAIAAASFLAVSPAIAADTISIPSTQIILSSALDAGSSVASTASSLLTSPEMKELGVYLAKTLIAWGVPAGVFGLVIVAAISRSFIQNFGS